VRVVVKKGLGGGHIKIPVAWRRGTFVVERLSDFGRDLGGIMVTLKSPAGKTIVIPRRNVELA
jgi:hypothetical protein